MKSYKANIAWNHLKKEMDQIDMNKHISSSQHMIYSVITTPYMCLGKLVNNCVTKTVSNVEGM